MNKKYYLVLFSLIAVVLLGFLVWMNNSSSAVVEGEKVNTSVILPSQDTVTSSELEYQLGLQAKLQGFCDPLVGGPSCDFDFEGETFFVEGYLSPTGLKVYFMNEGYLLLGSGFGDTLAAPSAIFLDEGVSILEVVEALGGNDGSTQSVVLKVVIRRGVCVGFEEYECQVPVLSSVDDLYVLSAAQTLPKDELYASVASCNRLFLEGNASDRCSGYHALSSWRSCNYDELKHCSGVYGSWKPHFDAYGLDVDEAKDFCSQHVHKGLVASCLKAIDLSVCTVFAGDDEYLQSICLLQKGEVLEGYAPRVVQDF